jgi:hypothetical protein
MAESSKETTFVEDGVEAELYTQMEPASRRYGNSLAGQRNNVKGFLFLIQCRRRDKRGINSKYNLEFQPQFFLLVCITRRMRWAGHVARMGAEEERI